MWCTIQTEQVLGLLLRGQIEIFHAPCTSDEQQSTVFYNPCGISRTGYHELDLKIQELFHVSVHSYRALATHLVYVIQLLLYDSQTNGQYSGPWILHFDSFTHPIFCRRLLLFHRGPFITCNVWNVRRWSNNLNSSTELRVRTGNQVLCYRSRIYVGPHEILNRYLQSRKLLLLDPKGQTNWGQRCSVARCIHQFRTDLPEFQDNDLRNNAEYTH